MHFRFLNANTIMYFALTELRRVNSKTLLECRQMHYYLSTQHFMKLINITI